MNVKTNIPLSTLTTMRLGGSANYVIEVTSDEDLREVYKKSKQSGQPAYIIGGGSNLIAHDEGFSGTIIHNKIMGIEVTNDNAQATTVTVGAGEIWDDFVKQMVERNLSGIEAMSGIPGTVGAAPVQNIGAYGQELADTFVSLAAYDTQNDSFVTLDKSACGFAYRHSIFRGEQMGRYIITRVTLILGKKPPQPPFYDALQKYFEQHQINTATVTIQMIRNAVLKIRSNKLPDPLQLPNAGSFFKNPIVEKQLGDTLKATHPDMPTYPVDETHVKIPAGWLIQSCMLKGKILHGIKVHDGNAVVLVNQSAKGYSDLVFARQEIIDAVYQKFHISLEQEPLELQ